MHNHRSDTTLRQRPPKGKRDAEQPLWRTALLITAVVAAAVVVAAVPTSVGIGPASATTPPDLPELPCPQQSALQLGTGVTLNCSQASAGPGSSFPAHVVTLDLSAQPSLDVVPANGAVWQYRDQPPGEYVPDAPVSAMLPADAAVAVNGGYFDINQNNGAAFSGTACSGMVSGGRILKTPALDNQGLANLVQYTNGQIYLGSVGFSGTVQSTTGSTPTIPLTSINDLADAGAQQRCPPDLEGDNQAAGTGVTLVTPDMGPVSLPAATATTPGPPPFQIPDALVVFGSRDGTTMTVTSTMQYDATTGPLSSLPALTGDQVALISSAPGNTAWLATYATVGASLLVGGSLTIGGSPTDQVQTLVGGGTMLVAGGQTCTVTNDAPFASGCGGSFPLGDGGPSSPHQETMVGVSQDGQHAYVVTVDQLSDTSGGISPEQDGAYMLSTVGAYQAVLFDGGGSTEMVGRTAAGGVPTLFSARYYKTQDPAGPNNQRYVANAIVVRAGTAAPPTPPTTIPSVPIGAPTTPSSIATPGPTGQKGELAATGPKGPPAPLAAVGIGLIGAGLLLVVAFRRRRVNRSGQ